MRPQPITLAAIVAVAVLVAAIVATAITGANGAPTQSVLVKRLPTAPVEVSAPSCALADAGAVSALNVTGVCHGRLTGAFTCIERPNLLAFSIDRTFGRPGQAFRLTIVISNPAGSGKHAKAGAVAQITGLGNVSRWSSRRLGVHVGSNGSVELDRSTLAPEPGTPATGALVLGGRASCDPEEP